MVRLFVLILFASSNAVGNMAIVDGKRYDLKPATEINCGIPGSPEISADKTVLFAAKKFGASTAEALCKAGKSEFCTKEAQTKFALNQLFTATRRYPSQYRSVGCKEVRAECVSLCSTENLLSSQDCLIECNQYDVWNK